MAPDDPLEDRGRTARDGEPVVPSRGDEIEAILDSIRRLTAERSGLAEPDWTGHDRPLDTPRRPVAAAPDDPPAPPPDPPAPPPPAPAEEDPGPPAAPQDGALLLTPERRVADPPLRLRGPVGGSVGDPDPRPSEGEIGALVAAALREELRGATGRDLTAAVRRLVRQEVNRVLAAREVDPGSDRRGERE